MTFSDLKHSDGWVSSPSGEPAPYAGYENWKGWKSLFTYSGEDASYFVGETRGLVIAGGDVLEIGFGAGSFLAWARDQRANIAGAEIIPALIDAAKREEIELLPADFERLGSSHATRFDTIAALDVFEHLSTAEIADKLRACELMLKPGGHLLLRFPNAQSPFGLAPQNGDLTHRMALSRGVFEQLMQGTEFEVVRYAPAFRIGGGGLAKGFIRRLRYAARDLIGAFLNAIYTSNIPWDPVVVLVLEKKMANDGVDGGVIQLQTNIISAL